MLKLKILNITSQRIWPIIRSFKKNKVSRRCNQCINSEHYQPLIDGICQDCISYNNKDEVENESQSDNQAQLIDLSETIQSFIGKGKKGYDALVFYSGGKDSTLLVHKLMEEYPQLRFLSVTIDNGVMSPIAIENINQIVSRLGFDHIFYRPNDNVFQRSFKFAIEQVKGRGCSQVVDMIDGDLFHDVGFHLAAKMEIPLILSGLSKEQVADIIKIKQFTLPADRLEQKRIKSGCLSLSDFAKDSDHDNYWWSPENYKQLPTVIYPNSVWDYTRDEIDDLIQNACGLTASRLEPLLTNNLLIPIMAVIDYRQIGYSSFEPEFSKMVRRGNVERKYWLNLFQFCEYSALNTRVFDKDVKQMFSLLNVDDNEVFSKE
jgi:hypothetical protein